MPINELLAIVVLCAGAFFSVVGVIGMMRLPDVYSRIHASGKVSTLGLVGLLIGISLVIPEITLKAVALAVFMVLTSPVASHAIAAAAHRQGVPRVGAERDDLGLSSP